MGRDSYESLLLLAREGRDILNKDRELSKIVREIKSSYKYNKYTLSSDLRIKKKYIENKLKVIIYNLYSNNKPKNLEGLNFNEKIIFLENFKLFLSPDVKEKIDIKVQGKKEDSFFKLTEDQQLNGTAYRILPKDIRNRYLNRSKLMARLTINVNKKNYEALSRALIQIFDHDPQKKIMQCKIMGPNKIGNRTDQAVIYLSDADVQSAEEVAQQIKALLPADALIDHTPIGMKQILPGISYSETVEGQSSSHGEARSVIVAKAITDSLLKGKELSITLPRELQCFGYDYREPALVSQVVKDGFLKIGLENKNKEIRFEGQSRDIQQFVLDPKQFCYSYKLNTANLNNIKNISNMGKVIFYRNKNEGYDMNYVDSSYSVDTPYALDCYFLDTNQGKSHEEFIDYIDIPKDPQDKKFLFLGRVNNGSIIVTKLDSENYRVYYDSRYNSSLLYEHVLMAFDGKGQSDNMFMYFEGEQWKLLSQNESRNDVLAYDPSSVKIQSPGDYSASNNKQEFDSHRESIHEKINLFANRFDIYFSSSEEYTSVDNNVFNKPHWLNLGYEIKKKLKKHAESLYDKINKLNSDITKINDDNLILKTKESIGVIKALNSLQNQQFEELYSDLLDVEYAFIWQNLKQKRGMDYVVKVKNPNENKFKIDNRLPVIERYESLLYLHKLTNNTEFKSNFNEGAKNYKNEKISDFNNTMTSIELKKLYLSEELSARERGALCQKIKVLEYAEYINKILTETGKISDFFYRNGSKVNRLIPQDFYLSITKSDSGGRCYPLVRAMAVALAKKGQEGADNLINKLYIAAANPDNRDSSLLKEGLKNLHSNIDAIEASYAYGKIILKEIKALLDMRDETMMFAVNTQNHSMLIGKKVIGGENQYYFYDPNFGIFSFSNINSLFSAVKKFFIEKQFAPYYSSFEKNNKPAFNVIYIDTDKMGMVPVGNNILVEDLNDADSLVIAETRQANVDKILKIQHEAYEDTQLKRSLMILDTEQWADKICEATFKLSSDNQLNGKWLPLFHNIEDDNNGYYRIQLLSVDNTELIRWVETTDKTFIDFHQYSLKKMAEFGRYYHIVDEELTLKPQGDEEVAFDGLNAGIAVQSIIQWAENRNRTESIGETDTSNLATALKIHAYINYMYITHSSAKDTILIAKLVKSILNHPNYAVAPAVALFSSSLARIADEGLTALFSGALISFDIYEIAEAENEPQKILFSTQLAFDSASFATGAAAIGAGAAGYVTASASLGSVGVIIAGMGIGFIALANNFAIIGEDAKSVGTYFSALDKAYQNGGMDYFEDKKRVIPRFGAIFKTIDFRSNQIEFDSQYIYRTSDRSSGGGRRNYIFWAGNFPTIVHDKQQAINIRHGIGYDSTAHIVDFPSHDTVFLPITPKSFIRYEYNLYPGATTRHDNGFDVIRRLEKTDHFDYDFYIFPSENIITHIYHEYVATPVTIKLRDSNQNLVIPTLPHEWKGFIEYKIEGNGGEYQLSLSDGVMINLIDVSINKPSRWFIDARALEDETIIVLEGKITVGSIDISIQGNQTDNEIAILTNRNEVFHVNLNEQNITLVSENENTWKNNIAGLKEHLSTLDSQHKLHQQYVIIENHQFNKMDVGRAYYDVRQERFIFTNPLSQGKKNGILGAVQDVTATFYSIESPSIWRVNIDSGNIIEAYPLENSQGRIFQIIKFWQNEEYIYFSCRYQDTGEVANYQLVSNKVKLVSLIGTPELMSYLAKTHTQLLPDESNEILTKYQIVNKNNVLKDTAESQHFAEQIMISGRDHNQAIHRYWLRTRDNQLIKPNLSPAFNYGTFPKNIKLNQSHWAIPEDLNLVGSLFDEYGHENFYFYSDELKLFYRQEGAGQDILDASKPSAWFMYTPELDSAFIWEGRILTIDISGVVSQINANGESVVIALNDKWFQGHPHWWQDLNYIYKDNSLLALLGIKSASDPKVVPAWYSQGKITIAHQFSSVNQLQFLGHNASNSGALIFDMTEKKLYEQPFATEQELTVAFADNSTLLTPASLPSCIDLYPNLRLIKITNTSEGLLIMAESGEILYVDLFSHPSVNTPSDLSSSLIINGSKDNDTLSPSIIKNVKNIILSGGEGQDNYLITAEAWENYQIIIIDNSSYDQLDDVLTLPVNDVNLLVVTRQENDLVIFDMHLSTTLILRQVFGEEAAAHKHLKVKIQNQSNAMSLAEFTEHSLHAEPLFNHNKNEDEKRNINSDQFAQQLVEKMAIFDFDSATLQQDPMALIASKNILTSNAPLLDSYL